LISKKPTEFNCTAFSLRFLDFPVLSHNCNTPLTDISKHKPAQIDIPNSHYFLHWS